MSMRNFNYLMLLFALIAGFATACNDDVTPEAKSEVEFSATRIEVEAAGQEVVVDYTITNPVKGAVLEAECAAEWIVDLSVSESAVTFTVAHNELDQERSATITFSYSGCADALSIEVVQEAAVELPFDIVVKDKSSLSFTYDVLPKDQNMLYIYMVELGENLDAAGVTTSEDYVAYDLAIIEREAEQMGITVETLVVEYYTCVGNVVDMEFHGVPPGDEFVIYAYGVKLEGGVPVATTDVVVVRDRTISAEIVECPIALAVAVDGGDAVVSYDPGTYSGRYFAFADKIENWCDEPNPSQEQLQQVAIDVWYSYLSLYLQYGFALGYVMDDTTISGVQTETYSLDPESDYFVAAIPIAETGVVYGYPSVETFRTEAVTMSDNKITLEVSNVGSRSAYVSVTTTNDDPYILSCFDSNYYEGMSDQEIIDSYIEIAGSEFTLNGDFSYTFEGLNPDTEYFVAAFGCKNGVITTELVRCDFKTLEAQDVSFEVSVDFTGHYDVAEIAALSSDYSDFVGYYDAIFTYTLVTTPQADGIYYGLYRSSQLQDLDLEGLRDYVMSRQLKHTFSVVNLAMYDLEYIILAVATDDKDNPSDLFMSEPFVLTYEDRSPAQEFFTSRTRSVVIAPEEPVLEPTTMTLYRVE